MLSFIEKKTIWDAIDRGRKDDLDAKVSYQLKIAQDLAVYDLIADETGLDIAEIGGGDSRILRILAESNRCSNIEKFEGANIGPKGEIKIPGVTNISAFIGEFSPIVRSESFDLVFSISVIEHVPTKVLPDFFTDMLRALRPGGRFIHAIDFYVNEEPTPYYLERYAHYCNWVLNDPRVTPLVPGTAPEFSFKCSYASNPDNIMFGWRQLAPALHDLRKTAQNVSFMVGGVKKG